VLRCFAPKKCRRAVRKKYINLFYLFKGFIFIAPTVISRINPIVNIIKNIIAITNPKILIEYNETLTGNNKTSSISNIRNNIATSQK